MEKISEEEMVFLAKAFIAEKILKAFFFGGAIGFLIGAWFS